MVSQGERVWFFDENAMHHNALVSKVHKDGTIDIEYEYKGKVHKETHVPHKNDTEITKTHPTQKTAKGIPRNWNVKVSCFKEMAVIGK